VSSIESVNQSFQSFNLLTVKTEYIKQCDEQYEQDGANGR